MIQQGSVRHAEQRALPERGRLHRGRGRRRIGRGRRKGVAGPAEVRGRSPARRQEEQVQRLPRQARRRHR